MRILFITVITLFYATLVQADSARRRVDPSLAWTLKKGNPKVHPAPSSLVPLSTPTAPIAERLERILAEGDPLTVAARISWVGGKVLGMHKGLVHAEVTREQLALLMQDNAIEGLRISHALKPLLNVSRPAVHADDVQAGAGLDRAYTGRGVIIGIVDTGIDITHAAFRNSDGSTRILSVWDQTYQYDQGFALPKGFDYGAECIAENINAQLNGDLGACITDDGKPISSIPTEGHGTHVAGIAGGSDSKYRGMAPEASFVIVRAQFEEGAILDGVDYVFSKCEEFGRPCVVNLSLGTTTGAHDGTSLIEQELQKKTGPGRIIVAAAGNEAVTEEIGVFGHARVEFDGAGYIKGPIVIANDQYASNPDYSLLLDLWANDSQNRRIYVAAMTKISGQLQVHNAEEFVLPKDENEVTKELTDGTKTWGYVHIVTGVDVANGKREVQIAIDRCSDKPCSLEGAIDTNSATMGSTFWVINFEDAGSAGSIDMWPMNATAYFFEGGTVADVDWTTSPVSANFAAGPHTFLGGDNESTITIPGTSPDIIAVASYITKTSWINAAGKSVSYEGTRGNISDFSSWGPSLNPNDVKPDITAPGEWITSAHSTKETTLPGLWEVNDLYANLQGTSMAAPHITGIVALMLQRNGKLTPLHLVGPQGILAKTVQINSFTGAVPNNQWGYGVVDALAAQNLVAAVAESDKSAPKVSALKGKIKGSTATISWTTDEPASSHATLAASEGSDKTGGQKSYVKHHSLVVRGLGDDREYSVTVKSADLAGNVTKSKLSGTLSTGGGCSCASREGVDVNDLLPFLFLFGFFLYGRRMSRL